MVGGPLPLPEEVSVTGIRGAPQLLPHLSIAWTFHMSILFPLNIQNVELLDGVHTGFYPSRAAGWHLRCGQSLEDEAGGSCGDILWTIWFGLMAMDFGVAVEHTRPRSATDSTLHCDRRPNAAYHRGSSTMIRPPPRFMPQSFARVCSAMRELCCVGHAKGFALSAAWI